MAGSPRVEKAARIRLENPNLSTEEAMKLAGYTDEEAKDQKRQSNVRQKTHRISKGRKRSSDAVELFNPDAKRMSFPVMQNNMYQANRRTSGLHLPMEQNMMPDYSGVSMDMQYNQQNRLSMDSMPYSHNQQMGYPIDNSSSLSQQYGMPQSHQPQHQQQQQQQQHYQQQQMPQMPHMSQMHLPQHQMQQPFQNQPMSPPAQAVKTPQTTRKESTAKSPGGSPRVERAARMRLEDPTVSTEEAMKLAGFTDEEARDRKKQNNVRQKTHRLSIKQAPKAAQKNMSQEVTSLIKAEVSRLEVKIDDFVQSFEARVELKFRELGNRIDEKFGRVIQLLEMQSVMERKRGIEPQSPPKDPDSNDDILDTIRL